MTKKPFLKVTSFLFFDAENLNFTFFEGGPAPPVVDIPRVRNIKSAHLKIYEGPPFVFTVCVGVPPEAALVPFGFNGSGEKRREEGRREARERGFHRVKRISNSGNVGCVCLSARKLYAKSADKYGTQQLKQHSVKEEQRVVVVSPSSQFCPTSSFCSDLMCERILSLCSCEGSFSHANGL